MNESTITVRYAKALYQVGEETGKLEVLKTNIDTLITTIKESIEFKELLNSPVIKTSEKTRLFNELFSKNFDPVIIMFFNLLAKNKREQFLYSMCLNFLQIFRDKQGIKEAIITTAQPLEKIYSDEILKFLKKKFKLNIELTQQVNPDLIGGFKLRIDDEQIDASISSKLRKIKNELINV
jgi:F-type H+-transporting ATPase subunit delta